MSSQRAEEEIGASGALAAELGSIDTSINVGADVIGSDSANPSATADPSSTGIPIISNDNDVSALPPVEESVPNSPVTSPSTLRQKPVDCDDSCDTGSCEEDALIPHPEYDSDNQRWKKKQSIPRRIKHPARVALRGPAC